MRGEIGRIGLMVPDANWVMERDFHNMTPEGILVNTSRMTEDHGMVFGVESLAEMSKDTEPCTARVFRALQGAEKRVIMFGCTSGSFLKGTEWDESLIKRMKTVTGEDTPCLTTTRSVDMAIKELGLKKLSVATPYPDDVNARLKIYLKNAGLEIVDFKALVPMFTGGDDLDNTTKVAVEVDKPEADGVFWSCTNVHIVDGIEQVEKEIGKPVVTSNQASMWACLKALGYNKPIKGYGVLLNKHL
jgi:maleate isomerase